MHRAAGTVVQLATSRGGVPKRAIAEAAVTRLGLAGDHQKHPKIHRGPDRAICLLAIEVIEHLQSEGHPITPGSTGENFTLRGIDWTTLQLGDQLALGDTVLLQITQLTKPCKQIAGSFTDGNFRRILAHGDSRLYARVLREGQVRVGDRVTVLDRTDQLSLSLA